MKENEIAFNWSERTSMINDTLERLYTKHPRPLDLVDVVRCKDCKHYRTRWVGFCELIGNENIHREDDDFCSYGERKTADEVIE